MLQDGVCPVTDRKHGFVQFFPGPRSFYLYLSPANEMQMSYVSHFESLKKYVIWYASCHGVRAESKVFAVGRHFNRAVDRPLRST